MKNANAPAVKREAEEDWARQPCWNAPHKREGERKRVRPFVCRFAVGRDGLAYSAVWRVWTHKNKPDLYIGVRAVSGELKASVHAPHPPHTGWRRHFGFHKDASSIISQQAKQHGGPHKVRWTGCEIGPDTTVEYRVIIRGTSLQETGQPVDPNEVALLPIPSTDEYVEVDVILGPTGPTQGYPRERDGETYLLSEGRLLSDDRRVWVLYIVRPYKESERITSPTTHNAIPSESSFIDPDADLNSARLRAIAFGAQPDGSLAFLDLKATWRPSST
jgi:hypothetical protein